MKLIPTTNDDILYDYERKEYPEIESDKLEQKSCYYGKPGKTVRIVGRFGKRYKAKNIGFSGDGYKAYFRMHGADNEYFVIDKRFIHTI